MKKAWPSKGSMKLYSCRILPLAGWLRLMTTTFEGPQVSKVWFTRFPDKWFHSFPIRVTNLKQIWTRGLNPTVWRSDLLPLIKNVQIYVAAGTNLQRKRKARPCTLLDSISDKIPWKITLTSEYKVRFSLHGTERHKLQWVAISFVQQQVDVGAYQDCCYNVFSYSTKTWEFSCVL